jgi:hypothetical protein
MKNIAHIGKALFLFTGPLARLRQPCSRCKLLEILEEAMLMAHARPAAIRGQEKADELLLPNGYSLA